MTPLAPRLRPPDAHPYPLYTKHRPPEHGKGSTSVGEEGRRKRGVVPLGLVGGGDGAP